MQTIAVAVLAAGFLAGGAARAQSTVEALGVVQQDSVRARALHVLTRLTYGPRPGDVDRVVALGVDRFIDQQLHPERIPDERLARRLERYPVLTMSSRELAAVFAEEQRDRLQRQRALAVPEDSLRARQERDMPDPAMRAERRQAAEENEFRRLLGGFQAATVTRAATSERQLYEVMVDFWTNHFNVFVGKGAVRFLLPDYIERTIRPRALGTFEDLLIATAQSPAMLFYLDNAQSVAPGSEPPQLQRLRQVARGRAPVAPRTRARADSARARLEQRLPQGINENYARELLELHTLGVDGGYTQQDVQNVARMLTGWSIGRPRQSPEFQFNAWAHDRGEKVVLGRRFPPGRGQDEGVELLRLLARHPSTMRHLSHKLCQRFVNDRPPDGCVDAGVRAWQRTEGDMREVVRAIVTSPDFWAPEHRAVKTKTPLEFVVSAVRALGAEPDSTPALGQVVARLGQPLYGQSPPTGYPETQESWVNSGALLQRMNVALGLAAGRLPGARADLEQVVPAAESRDALIETINRTLLNGVGSPNTLRVMREQTADLDGMAARTLLVGLALGSPEFQRQ